MQVELSREEIEKIILDHVNEMFVVPQVFNTVEVKYSNLPERITVSYQPKE
jgi:hypothetical protein